MCTDTAWDVNMNGEGGREEVSPSIPPTNHVTLDSLPPSLNTHTRLAHDKVE